MLLQDTLRDKENDIQKDIEEKLAAHRAWLNKFPDLTRMPLLPAAKQSTPSTFRAVVAEYLPSPPESASSGSPKATSPNEAVDGNPAAEDNVIIRYSSPPSDEPTTERPSYRRRIGRGGRLMIDRRGLHLQSRESIDPVILDRFKFDQDDDDEAPPVYTVDPLDQWSMQYRISQLRNRDPHAPPQLHINTARAQQP